MENCVRTAQIVKSIISLITFVSPCSRRSGPRSSGWLNRLNPCSVNTPLARTEQTDRRTDRRTEKQA